MAASQNQFPIILEHLQRLRMLEKDAALDPGYEEDHDHVTTQAYDAYRAAFQQLSDILEQSPLMTWIELFGWTKHNNHYFGGVSMPGAHLWPCGWQPRLRSVRTMLLEHVLRAVKKNPDDQGWEDARLQAMLADVDWRTEELKKEFSYGPRSERTWDELRAEIIARLGRKFPLGKLKGDPIVKLVADFTDPARLFSVDDLTLVSTRKSIVLTIHFTHNLDVWQSVWVSLMDRRSELPVSGVDALLMLDPKFGLKGTFRWKDTWGTWTDTTIKAKADQIKLFFPKELWNKLGIKTGTELALKVEIPRRGEYISKKTIAAP